MRSRGFSLQEVLITIVLVLVLGGAAFKALVVGQNTFFSSSALLDLQQHAREGIDRMTDELRHSASGKVTIYQCPSEVCEGGAIAFQVPVVTDDPIAGSTFKPTGFGAAQKKWGFDGRESSSPIIYLAPAAGGALSQYSGKLIRLTSKDQYCGNGICETGETIACCPDCSFVSGDGVCCSNLGERSWNSSDCGACFLKETPIQMADGTSKNIEDIKIGDMVLSFDEQEKKLVADEVKNVAKQKADNYIIINGHLRVTPNHPFYSNGRWMPIGDLQVGDVIFTSQAKEELITEIVKVEDTVEVYDIEVNPYHNYFAGGYLVHNKEVLPEIPPVMEGGGSFEIPGGRSWLGPRLFLGIAFAQEVSPLAPNIDMYDTLPALDSISNYDIKILAEDVRGVYFLGTPLPPDKPNTVTVFVDMYKEIFGGGDVQTHLSTEMKLRNLSL